MSRIKPAYRSSAAAALVLIAALATGCSSDKKASPSSNVTSAPAITGTVTVLAAASLTEAFTTLGKQFEAAHPGTTVKLSFGASSALAQQVINGAPADVFASASTKNMDQVVAAKDAADGQVNVFAKNVLEVAVPPSNPAKITGVADLAKPGVKVAVCAPSVPAGAGAVQLFKNYGVTVTPATEEADVKATLTKVQSGEVDAGIVYVTDVRAAGSKVKGIEIPAEKNYSTSYPVAPLTKSANSNGALAFSQYVLSPEGAKVLTADGFAKP